MNSSLVSDAPLASPDANNYSENLQSLVEKMNARFRNVAASVEDHNARLARVEEYLAENGGEVRAPEFEREEPVQR
jgi:hypothetical protein